MVFICVKVGVESRTLFRRQTVQYLWNAFYFQQEDLAKSLGHLGIAASFHIGASGMRMTNVRRPGSSQ